MKEEIDEHLHILVGQPLTAGSHAADMVMFGFGPEVTGVVHGRTMTRVGIWLHIQCPWRIVREGVMLVGYGDYHWPPIGSAVDYDEFEERDAPRSRRDDLVDSFVAHGDTAHIVVEAEGATIGDLRVALSDGCVLEVFPHEATQGGDGHDEYWRLLPGIDATEHFVVTAHGVET